MPTVKCTVCNCEYWAAGNECSADQILITAGFAGGKNKHGENAERMGQTPVRIAEDSFCWTMVPRQANANYDEEEDEVEAGIIHIPLI